ncbi:MAG TPA: cell surface protein [Comamonadaceae bacterium]|uniref:cell surface protein n=1 Tax=Pulveribacter sp. TaxID=2678893 RepID=UPI000ED82C02|nr:cell surface protein [Pulveribacter sp.]HCL86958.1 cell surface protein [Comamonadaceae bacterium]
MKKNLLAVSIAAMIGGLGFAGAASAGDVVANTGATNPATELSVTPDGIGHILLVPYFSTQNGNVSLLNIVNTDSVNGKAVKLRYRGASNSDDIFDITVYLSPGDMWSANVSQENGVSRLVTNDNSCTLPSNVNASFSTERVHNGNPTETLEGYIEILNMADVPPSSSSNPLFKAIKHVNGVAPCETMPEQFEDIVDAAEMATRGYGFPTGGLMANWSIVNLEKSGSFTGDATAILAHTGNMAQGAAANLVYSPQDDQNQGASGSLLTPADLTADPLLAGGLDKDGVAVTARVTAKNYDFPDLSTPYVTALGATAALDQAHALSAALATTSITNEYMTSDDVGFATDWTFSMPSRRYNVAVDYVGGTDGKPRAIYADGADYFTPVNAKLTSAGAQVCVTSAYKDLQYYNTEEGEKASGGYVISPQPAGANLSFCGETSVLAFNVPNFTVNTPTSVLGATVARQNIVTAKSGTEVYTDGWMRVALPGNAGLGLPVVGHAFVKALSSTANLGGIWKHRVNLVNP